MSERVWSICIVRVPSPSTEDQVVGGGLLRSAVGLRQRLQILVQVSVICRLNSVQYLHTITLKMVTDCAVINKVEFYFQV